MNNTQTETQLVVVPGAVGLPRLSQIIEDIERNPDHYDQTVWHCRTSHCLAGFVDVRILHEKSAGCGLSFDEYLKKYVYLPDPNERGLSDIHVGTLTVDGDELMTWLGLDPENLADSQLYLELTETSARLQFIKFVARNYRRGLSFNQMKTSETEVASYAVAAVLYLGILCVRTYLGTLQEGTGAVYRKKEHEAAIRMKCLSGNRRYVKSLDEIMNKLEGKQEGEQNAAENFSQS